MDTKKGINMIIYAGLGPQLRFTLLTNIEAIDICKLGKKGSSLVFNFKEKTWKRSKELQ